MYFEHAEPYPFPWFFTIIIIWLIENDYLYELVLFCDSPVNVFKKNDIDRVLVSSGPLPLDPSQPPSLQSLPLQPTLLQIQLTAPPLAPARLVPIPPSSPLSSLPVGASDDIDPNFPLLPLPPSVLASFSEKEEEGNTWESAREGDVGGKEERVMERVRERDHGRSSEEGDNEAKDEVEADDFGELHT